ncbi:B lymphocyte-induced maturation protein 1 homolog [Ornithodoros turicata]|uniref:B lymphocyte-induced maturation protein 1 homolog n=1 Tax=Ornithodoros turicata TaxID=34597 RepID=UPI00313A0CF1
MGKKPNKCDLCTAEFTQGSHLSFHKRRHTGEKPYKCDLCPAEFIESTKLRSHKQTQKFSHSTNTHQPEDQQITDLCPRFLREHGYAHIGSQGEPGVGSKSSSDTPGPVGWGLYESTVVQDIQMDRPLQGLGGPSLGSMVMRSSDRSSTASSMAEEGAGGGGGGGLVSTRSSGLSRLRVERAVVTSLAVRAASVRAW